MNLTNILLLAVVAVIFWRLWSVLGRRTGGGRPPPRLDPYVARDVNPGHDRDNVLNLPRNSAQPALEVPPANVEDRLGAVPVDSNAREALREIAVADPAFDAGAFLKGAKTAYEMVVTAFAKGDREMLKGLLSNEVYESFDKVISERESRGETTEFSFVGISSAEITDARLANRFAHVTVKFVSDLVTAIRDSAGAVVEGDVKAVRQVTDIWTFMRDVRSANPNWRVIATDAS